MTRAIALFAVLLATGISAQVGTPVATWEALVRVPLPADSEPVISLNGLVMPAEPVAEHSHPGQTIGYITSGEIENQVMPDPPAFFKPGGYFVEAPRQLHKVMRNVSTVPATLDAVVNARTNVNEYAFFSPGGNSPVSMLWTTWSAHSKLGSNGTCQPGIESSGRRSSAACFVDWENRCG
jgi:quercetin dioxygenase-like cupin family protein